MASTLLIYIFLVAVQPAASFHNCSLCIYDIQVYHMKILSGRWEVSLMKIVETLVPVRLRYGDSSVCYNV